MEVNFFCFRIRWVVDSSEVEKITWGSTHVIVEETEEEENTQVEKVECESFLSERRAK